LEFNFYNNYRMSKGKDYKQVTLASDADFQGNWDLVLPLCQKEHHNNFINPRIHEAFVKNMPHHEKHYFVHVATGPHHASDHWTVQFNMNGHRA